MNTDATEGPVSLADYDYDLPDDLIAKSPARPRDRSRLLVVARRRDSWVDSRFSDLANHLEPGDLLVLNDTRVLNARLFGRLERTGRPVQMLFASPLTEFSWEVMLHPGRRIREGDRILIDDRAALVVGEHRDHGLRKLAIASPPGLGILELLASDGQLPLPPYIPRDTLEEDKVDYQTVYAERDGAIAAPTAGLHFSREVFQSLQAREIETARITLHVGAGTFLPVRTENAAEHQLKPERFEISDTAARALNRARAEGRRIIAVGTTTTRALEHAFGLNALFEPGSGSTGLYIVPGHRFQAIDGLLTNFHLPRSTLLLLVSAFASRDRVLGAYHHAIREGYRFYSYGDCTLFL